MAVVFATPIISGLTGLCTNLLYDKAVRPGIDRKVLESAIHGAVDQAIQAIQEEFRDCFVRQKGLLDDSFWKHQTVKEEIEAALLDRRLARELDPQKIWPVYEDIFPNEADRLPKERFVLVLQAVWSGFIRVVCKERLFDPYYDRKALGTVGEKIIFADEARRLMKEYCRIMARTCAEKIRNKYCRKAGVATEEDEQEFGVYIDPTMLWLALQAGKVTRVEEDEREVKNKAYLNEQFVIFTGRGGVGKTRFFEELERERANELMRMDDPPYIPFYFEARKLTEITTPEKLIEHIEKKILAIFKSSSDFDDDIALEQLHAFAAYLYKRAKLFVLVDAFDQAPNFQEGQIAELLTSNALLGKMKRYVSTRPYDLNSLLEELHNEAGLKGARFVELQPFTEDQVREYFGGYFDKVETIYRDLKKRRWEGNEISLLQIPLLAYYVKIMAANGEVDQVRNSSDLLGRFINHVLYIQASKDKGHERSAIREFGVTYKQLLPEMERLALGTLLAEDDNKFVFNDDRVRRILGGSSCYRSLEFMARAEILKPIIDHDSHPDYRFQHQILQEYLAARQLRRLYRDRNRSPDSQEELLDSLKRLAYDPDEVGTFLGELIATDSEAGNPPSDFNFWQGLLMAPTPKDADGEEDRGYGWIRTYALQIRDAIAQYNEEAAGELAKIFAEETIQGNSESEWLLVPDTGDFLLGSYEDSDERAVRLVSVPDFEIARFPVTNLQFCSFLSERFAGVKEITDREGRSYIDFSRSRISVAEKVYSIKKGFGNHPVTSVSWYGAKAYCDWQSEKSGDAIRLPSEKEWEKAARGCNGRRYPWGNEFGQERCNVERKVDDKDRTTKVGNFPKWPSPYGCQDMAGNVWEWTGTEYYGRKELEDFPFDPELQRRWDERNWETLLEKLREKDRQLPVLRGGSWFNHRVLARCATRDGSLPSNRSFYVGFRCARTKK